jgi:hypothetical protein
MTRARLDLSRNLTEKRVPAELQGHAAYRLVIWVVDQDTGSKSVYDIYEGVGKFAIYLFNRQRTSWANDSLLVDLEPAVYV